MTVSTTTAAVAYNGDGATTVLAVPFYFLASAQLLVQQVNTLVSPPTITTLAINVGYTVQNAGVESGGSITLAVAAPVGTNTVITRNVPFTQLIHYVPNDPFPASTHEQALDQLTMEVQQINTQVALSVTLPSATLGSGISATLPYPLAGQFLAWNNTGTALINASPTGVGPGTVTGGVAGAASMIATGTITDSNIASAAGIASTKINFSQPLTTNYFSNGGAIINRFNDRLFIGGATACSGDTPQTNNDWFSSYLNANGYSGVTLLGQMVLLNNNSPSGTITSVTASQSAFATSAGASCIATQSVAVNNHNSLATQAWALYAECHNITSAVGSAIVCELDIRTLFPSVTPNPYTQGSTIGLQIAAGAGVQGGSCDITVTGTVMTVSNWTPLLGYNIAVGARVFAVGIPANTIISSFGTGTGGNGTYNINNSASIGSPAYAVVTLQSEASAAIQIENNPVKFQAGIVFGATSLTGTDGVTGSAVALSMARGHTLQWYYGGGVGTSSITCTGTTSAGATQINFTEGQLNLATQSNGSAIAVFAPNSSAVNTFFFEGATTGNTVNLQVQGTDTNIGITAVTKGTGLFGVSYAATNATSPTSFSATRTIAMKFGGTTLFIPADTVGW